MAAISAQLPRTRLDTRMREAVKLNPCAMIVNSDVDDCLVTLAISCEKTALASISDVHYQGASIREVVK